MNWIADDLARRGYAVWNIDYRGVDRPGGGYPGTFRDVAAAADALRGQAAANNLDFNIKNGILQMGVDNALVQINPQVTSQLDSRLNLNQLRASTLQQLLTTTHTGQGTITLPV